MLHRIHHAMVKDAAKIGTNCPFETDETLVGGKAKNMHKKDITRKFGLHGEAGKVIVHGIKESARRREAEVGFSLALFVELISLFRFSVNF